ncbi:hypothetical protein [Mesorhizobium sp. M7A.F.Ca.CA.004.02.1.1]|uniref:hypothetical protein n=1 Tax=Mesorhizobium sp. M7A.F.Ca.CA.004.02.1.1 TaxID=2496690 RepID=UPI000FCA012C|nr:hypothetical protein [Mesorhizobium sp. M7A.F.Ca.CA.004.02.1.1]RVB02835.1 hypothetical protein EN912_10310 [Mesorhizobium sp. M7A.F.Ca.CA.004.02.1.1]
MFRPDETERARQMADTVAWITETCRKEIPEAGPWGLRIEPTIVFDWTGLAEVKRAVIQVWSIDRWVWWVTNDLHAIKWQYRQALMQRHYADRRAA